MTVLAFLDFIYSLSKRTYGAWVVASRHLTTRIPRASALGGSQPHLSACTPSGRFYTFTIPNVDHRGFAATPTLLVAREVGHTDEESDEIYDSENIGDAGTTTPAGKSGQRLGISFDKQFDQLEVNRCRRPGTLSYYDDNTARWDPSSISSTGECFEPPRSYGQ